MGADSIENIAQAICDKIRVIPSECSTFRTKKVDKEYDINLISWTIAWIIGWLVAICFFHVFWDDNVLK